MKRLINKIVVKINKDKVRHWVKKKTNLFLKKTDYYICRTCRQLLPESEMNPEDSSICKRCSND